ncbi:succinate--CoA ligase [ADP-forming] subunit beta [Actinomycetota bacterium]|nr:succinate--CoA ligase [ADP-forming] subunit beta [Actinomycetota bacterium]
MNLYEFQSRRLLKDVGVKVADGEVLTSSEPTRWSKFPSVVKAQVKTGGRGKLGGVKVVQNSSDLRTVLDEMFKLEIKNHNVERVLIVPAAQIVQEFYISITFDRSRQKYLLMFSSDGGVDIEELAASRPEAIIKHWFSATKGLTKEEVQEVLGEIAFCTNSMRDDVIATALKCWKCFVENDATLVEINPLAVVENADGIEHIEALDAKISLDDNASFRHLELFEELDKIETKTEPEKKAAENDIAYVQLDGEVGIVGNGAGLVMSTLDLVSSLGAKDGVKPANFLDIGGGASAQKMQTSLELVLDDENVKSVFINIFGGLTQCTLVAQGILGALENLDSEILRPLFVRLAGNEAAQGRTILQATNNPLIKVFQDDNEAAKEAICSTLTN